MRRQNVRSIRGFQLRVDFVRPTEVRIEGLVHPHDFSSGKHDNVLIRHVAEPIAFSPPTAEKPVMSDDSDAPTVPVVCPRCETTTRVAVADLAEAVDTHNENLHDGADVAHVDPDVVERITELAAEDLGLREE
jgi:hypothetical protein